VSIRFTGHDFSSSMCVLGIDPDYVAPKDDPRRVVINELQIVFKDHPDKTITLKFATEDDIKNAKKHALVLKEASLYRFRVSFRVQHNVVLGLQIKNTVSKLGKELAKDVEMLGTYPPKNEFQFVDIPKNDWNEAPSGMLARGEYKAHMKFVDDDSHCHLDFEYAVKIAKDFSSDE
jgi:Rho GDP-dissociation inhibitor